MPRLLSSCPSAVRRLLKKAELMGINTQVEHHATTKDIRKKWHVPIAFSVEYIGYFLERDNRIKNLKKHVEEIIPLNKKYREQETELRKKYDQVHATVTELRKTNQKLKEEGENLWKYMSTLADEKLSIPELIAPKKSPLKVTTNALSCSKKEQPLSPPIGVILQHCGICNKSRDQHQMARCDQCKKFYHLGCLDPPLTRMPKKTKLCGWQCSECTPRSSDESEDPDANPDAPRKLREKIKEPLKFTQFCDVLPVSRSRDYPPTYGIMANLKLELAGGKPKSRPRKKIKKTPETAEAIIQKKATTSATRIVQSMKERKMFPMECATCLKPGDNSTAVRCDECTLCYHFECLDPPLKKTPKRRGYSWHCEACDPNKLESDYFESDDEQDDTSADPNVRFKINKRKHSSTDEESETNGEGMDEEVNCTKSSDSSATVKKQPSKIVTTKKKSSRSQTNKKNTSDSVAKKKSISTNKTNTSTKQPQSVPDTKSVTGKCTNKSPVKTPTKTNGKTATPTPKSLNKSTPSKAGKTGTGKVTSPGKMPPTASEKSTSSGTGKSTPSGSGKSAPSGTCKGLQSGKTTPSKPNTTTGKLSSKLTTKSQPKDSTSSNKLSPSKGNGGNKPSKSK